MKTYYQLDRDLAFSHATSSPAKAYMQVEVAPPAPQTGFAHVWQTELDPVADASFGDVGAGEWVTKEDHRKDALYTSEGEYRFGDDFEGKAYNGLGAIPSWLSTQAPEPEPQPEPVPQQITMRQCQLWLFRNDMLDTAEQMIDSLPEPQKTEAQIEWRTASIVARDNPLIAMMATFADADEQAVDQWFIEAGSI